MQGQARLVQKRRSGALFAAIAALVLGIVIALGGASPALATHKATIDKDADGNNASMLTVTGATTKAENFQFGTYEDPLGDLKINMKEVNSCASRDLYVKNATKYKVNLTLWGVAQANYKNFTWLWFGNSSKGNGMVNSEGTKDVVIMNTILTPGEQVQVRAFKNGSTPSDVRLTLKVRYSYNSEVAKIQTAKPVVSATKLSGSKVEVCVTLPDNAKSAVNKTTKLDLYQGSKKVKSWTYSAQTPVRKYTAKGSAAVKASYHAVATTIGDKSDTIKGKSVKPKSNVLTVGKKPSLKKYEKYQTTFAPTKLSYKGKKLVIEGYTVNTNGVALPSILFVQVSVPGKQIANYTNYQYKYAKGLKKVKFTLKASGVINLRAGNVNVHAS